MLLGSDCPHNAGVRGRAGLWPNPNTIRRSLTQGTVIKDLVLENRIDTQVSTAVGSANTVYARYVGSSFAFTRALASPVAWAIVLPLINAS